MKNLLPLRKSGIAIFVLYLVMFSVRAQYPIITSFMPTSGISGTKVNIYGSNLLNTTEVRFGGTLANIIKNSSTTITVTLNAGTSGYVRVETPLGTDSSVVKFSFIPYLTYPANGTVVTINPRIYATSMPLAGTYTFQVSIDSSFNYGYAREYRSLPNVNWIQLPELYYDTKYFIRVKNAASADNYGKITSFTTIKPEYLTYMVSPSPYSSTSKVNLNIISNSVPGAHRYTIQIAEDDFVYYPDIKFERTDTSRIQSFNGLNYNTTYYVRIKTDLSDSYGRTLQFTTGKPEDFTYMTSPVPNSTNNNINLNISSNIVAGADPNSYDIQLSEKNDFNNVVEKIGARTQLFTGLKLYTTYFVRIKTNLSDFGKINSFITGDANTLSYIISPSNNSKITTLQPFVVANTIPGANFYRIQLSTDQNFNSIAFDQSSTSAKISFSGLSYNTIYYARDSTDISNGWGPVRSFTTGTTLDFAYITYPGNNSTGVNTSVTLTSNLVPGALQYTIQLSNNRTFSTNVLEQKGPDRTYKVTGLQYNTRYYGRVNTDQDIDIYGKVDSFVVGSPTNLAYVLIPGNNAINQLWQLNITLNALPGANNYTLELNTNKDFSGTSLSFSSVDDKTIIAVNGLQFNTTYYSRVQSSLDLTNWGPVKSFTTTSPLNYSYIISPKTGAINVNFGTNILAYPVVGANSYVFELTPINPADSSVAGSPIISNPGSRITYFNLSPQTFYRARVQTNLLPGQWGATRYFTTISVNDLSYIISPLNGSTGVPISVIVTTNVVPGASNYSIELNTSPYFTGSSIIKNGTNNMRSFSFSGLDPNTNYYGRVRNSLFPTGVWSTLSYFFTTTITKSGNIETGINNSEELNSLVVYPNPTNGLVNISLKGINEESAINIYDINGKLLDHLNINILHEQETRFDISSYKPGIYIVTLHNNHQSIQTKIIKE